MGLRGREAPELQRPMLLSASTLFLTRMGGVYRMRLLFPGVPRRVCGARGIALYGKALEVGPRWRCKPLNRLEDGCMAMNSNNIWSSN